jgi:hypothetical protein
MLTPFQRNYIQQVQLQPDFSHLIVNYHTNEYSSKEEEAYPKTRPLPVLFYTTDGKLHLHQMGQKRLLRKMCFDPKPERAFGVDQ